MKNDTIDSLLSDGQFVFDSFIDLIKDESNRIASNKLACKDEIDSFIAPIVNNAIFNRSISDLFRLHNCLKNVKFAEDFILLVPKEEAAPTNKEEVKVEEGVCCSSCESGEECCGDVKEASVYNKLEKIANESGLNGKHEAAYIIEKFIQYNK